MKQTTYRTDLTEPEFELIKPCLHIRRCSKWPLIRVLSAIFYVCCEGIKWRALPGDFELPWETVYWYFRKWQRAGTWAAVNEQLVMIRRQAAGHQPLPTVVVIDSQSVKNSATATGQVGVDGGKKIKGRKRLLICDSAGNLLYARVIAANRHDGPAARRWWEQELSRSPMMSAVSVVRGDHHFGGVFKKGLEASFQIAVQISGEPVEKPSQKTMPVHKGRWVVERTIAWKNNSRRLSKDYERLPDYAEAFCLISSISRMLRNPFCPN